MLQLMHQQQYIQQMANQAAIAMAYFLEQQQMQQHYRSNSNVSNINHKQKVASMSYDNGNNIGNNIGPNINNNKGLKMPFQPKRLDTMDNILSDDADLPPSMMEDNMLDDVQNDDNFEFAKGGEKTMYDLDPEDQPDFEDEDDIENEDEEQMLPPPNPMEADNLNVIQQQPNMRKI